MYKKKIILLLLCNNKKDRKKCNNMQKKRENYLVPPGPLGPPGQKVLGPVVLAGQDLETLKVLWSRGPGTKEVQKVPRTKNWKSPGTMETLVKTPP